MFGFVTVLRRRRERTAKTFAGGRGLPPARRAARRAGDRRGARPGWGVRQTKAARSKGGRQTFHDSFFSWYSFSAFTFQTASRLPSPAMARTASMAVSIEWSILLYLC